MHQRHVDVKLLQELLLQAHFIFQTSDTFICIDSYAQGYNWCLSANSNIENAV